MRPPRLLVLLVLTFVSILCNASSINLPFVMYPKLQLADDQVSDSLLDTNVCKCKLVCWWKASCSSFTYFPNSRNCNFSHSTTATHSMFSPAEETYSFIKNNFSSGVNFRAKERMFLYVDVRASFGVAGLYCPYAAALAGLGDAATYDAVKQYLIDNNVGTANIWVNGGYDGTEWAWVDGTPLPSQVGQYPWGSNFPFEPIASRNRTWMSPSQGHLLVNQSPDKLAAVLCELPAV